jgi:hypothetical protein
LTVKTWVSLDEEVDALELLEELSLLEEVTLLEEVVIEVDGLLDDELGVIELLLLHAAKTSKVRITKGNFFNL